MVNFCKAFEENDAATIEKEFTSYLRKTISIRDTSVKKEMKDNFYHGILLGLFGNMADWKVKSNAEPGDGYSDISVEVEDREIGFIINKNYEETLIDDGMKTIYKYGIACYKNAAGSFRNNLYS